MSELLTMLVEIGLVACTAYAAIRVVRNELEDLREWKRRNRLLAGLRGRR